MNKIIPKNIFGFLLLIIFLIAILSGCQPTPTEAELFVNSIIDLIANKTPDFYEDFSSNQNNWGLNSSVVSSEHGSLELIDGEYSITASNINYPDFTMMGGGCSSLNCIADFVLEFDVRKNSNAIANCSLGVKIRDLSIDTVDSYIFIDPGSRNLTILGGDEILHGSQKIFINTGNQVNHLKIFVQGKKIAVLINGKYAAFVTNTSYVPSTKGAIRLLIGNNTNFELEARYDNIKVWFLEDIAAPPSPPKLHQ